jgi:hypothetical protein
VRERCDYQGQVARRTNDHHGLQKCGKNARAESQVRREQTREADTKDMAPGKETHDALMMAECGSAAGLRAGGLSSECRVHGVVALLAVN